MQRYSLKSDHKGRWIHNVLTVMVPTGYENVMLRIYMFLISDVFNLCFFYVNPLIFLFLYAAILNDNQRRLYLYLSLPSRPFQKLQPIRLKLSMFIVTAALWWMSTAGLNNSSLGQRINQSLHWPMKTVRLLHSFCLLLWAKSLIAYVGRLSTDKNALGLQTVDHSTYSF